jgi:hypothetical protein
MKKALFILLALFIWVQVFAQNTNCWYSMDYVLMGKKFNKKGLVHVKNKKAYVCFNNGALSFFTEETGLVTFNYLNTWSGVDSSFNNQPKWEGNSLENMPVWLIKMTYNDKIWINNSSGWTVQLMKISHTVNGKRKFKKK